VNNASNILKITFLALILVFISRITNFGYLTLIAGPIVFIFLLLHLLFQIILFFKSRKKEFFNLKLSMISNGLIVFSSLILPDSHDTASYMFFALIKNPPDFFAFIALILFIAGMIISFLSIFKSYKNN
jgi:hypothetical protein